MSHIIHLRCDRCGAPTDARGVVWIHCPSCGAIAGYDFTSYVDSPEMAEFTRRNFDDPTGYVERWNKHDAELTRAVALHRKSPAEALEIAAEQAEFVLAETPWVAPPAVKTDPSLRDAHKRWLGFELLHYRLPGQFQALYSRLNEATAAIGFGANENPLPAFQQMVAVLREMLELRVKLGCPPDPDGLSLNARLRVQSSQMIAAYIRLVSPELQLDLLRAVYGEQAVKASGPAGQNYSVFFDWECPRCGLFSPQAVGADKLTCLGCYCGRRFDADAQAFAATSVLCHGCGSRLELAANQMHAVCAWCASQVKRFVRPGEAHRAVMADIKRAEVEKHGGSYEEMMAETDGFGVTPENRLDRLRDGLVRIAQFYFKFITPARFLGFARASLHGSSNNEVDALLAAAEQLADQQTREGWGTPEAGELVRRARAKLIPGTDR